MRPIEPGEAFEVTYGNGRKITLFALSKRGEFALSTIEEESKGVSGIEAAYEQLEKALRLFLPEHSIDAIYEMTEGMNLPLLQELVSKAVATTHVSEEDAKKSD